MLNTRVFEHYHFQIFANNLLMPNRKNFYLYIILQWLKL